MLLAPDVKYINIELSYLVQEIRLKIQDINNYKAFVIKFNPKKDDEYSELPIKDVSLDEDGDEINIVLHDCSVDEDNHETLSVFELLVKLEAFMPKASSFHLFVSHPVINLDDEYYARLDVPVVGHGLSEESCRFGLLEQESKKDST